MDIKKGIGIRTGTSERLQNNSTWKIWIINSYIWLMMQFRKVMRIMGSTNLQISYLLLIFRGISIQFTTREQKMAINWNFTTRFIPKWRYKWFNQENSGGCVQISLHKNQPNKERFHVRDIWSWLHDRLKFQSLADRGQYQSLPVVDLSLAGQGHSKHALKCIQVN